MAASLMTLSWTDDETFRLIDAWGDETIQALLEGCTRNCHVYEKIAHELEEAGYTRTWSQCRDKIKKLKREYKKLKDYHDETGRKRKFWKFFERIDDILGTRPATQPSSIIDTFKEGTPEPVQMDELKFMEDVENPVGEVMEKELEDVRGNEIGEVNEIRQGEGDWC